MRFVFKHNTTGTVESMVQWLSGKMVHVDMIPEMEEDPKSYTSYMFEHFSENPVLPTNAETHTEIEVPMSSEENKRAIEFLQRLVAQRVPYNYADMVGCIVPGTSLLRDVSPDAATSIFCSQAAVLCLRHALEPDRQKVITSLNSRITTPSMLYEALLPLTKNGT